MLFQPVAEGKTARNQVHLDINIGESAAPHENGHALALAHADRCVAAGATLIEVFDSEDDWHISRLDPEGNEHCIR